MSSEVIFESIMDAENVNNMLKLYRNTTIMVIRIKRKAYLIMIIPHYHYRNTMIMVIRIKRKAYLIMIIPH